MIESRRYCNRPCYIKGMGLISPLGEGIEKTMIALENGMSGIGHLSLFPTPSNRRLPVGQVREIIQPSHVPRTHQLARIAATQAMQTEKEPPDAIILGVCTGGMPVTERLLKDNEQSHNAYRYHAVGSVAEYLADIFGCTGPVITVSTACSSGAVAITLGMEMIRAGMAKKVLAGGADALCRLTYYGFSSLQLVDSSGARPLDINRRGMSVSEGAAMLLLTDTPPCSTKVQILGAGLSCDAYHPVAPHPQGRGAVAAMKLALSDSGYSKDRIDYINLHGTGTVENDLAEARAINALFSKNTPLTSSVKGAFGHSLGASGAIEAVITAICIDNGFIPANTGCISPDPALGLQPVLKPARADISTVLSNSFGFGGNNASLVIGPERNKTEILHSKKQGRFLIVGQACITGKGDTEATFQHILKNKTCKGIPSIANITDVLSSKAVRRLKTLPRLAMLLAIMISDSFGYDKSPSSVFFGTGWGAMSETYDFLTCLFETKEQFPSPTDFSSSVHNAPAGQIAMLTNAQGPNITTSGGDYSFEQALLASRLVNTDSPFLVLAADEAHSVLSPLFDGSVTKDDLFSAGGGGFLLARQEDMRLDKNDDSVSDTKTHHALSRAGSHGNAVSIDLAFYENVGHNPNIILSMIKQLTLSHGMTDRYGAVLVGIPARHKKKGMKQLETFLFQSGFKGPVIDYRKFTGQFASASAVATVIAAKFMEYGRIPGIITGGKTVDLDRKGILVIGLGSFITAIEVDHL